MQSILGPLPLPPSGGTFRHRVLLPAPLATLEEHVRNRHCRVVLAASTRGVGRRAADQPLAHSLHDCLGLRRIRHRSLPCADQGSCRQCPTAHPDVVFILILPALLFESSLNIEIKLLRENLRSIVLFAVVGVTVATTITGFVVHQILGLLY
ncbi:MAG: cation:proton antiporter [Bryobacterales bacterium]|nr:cation:proton antiporter [Bryobacterales bacterium]